MFGRTSCFKLNTFHVFLLISGSSCQKIYVDLWIAWPFFHRIPDFNSVKEVFIFIILTTVIGVWKCNFSTILRIILNRVYQFVDPPARYSIRGQIRS